MLLAMAQAETPPGGSFDALFRSTATGTVSEATKTRAKALFVTLPKNTDYDFGRILKTLKKPVSTAGLTISY